MGHKQHMFGSIFTMLDGISIINRKLLNFAFFWGQQLRKL